MPQKQLSSPLFMEKARKMNPFFCCTFFLPRRVRPPLFAYLACIHEIQSILTRPLTDTAKRVRLAWWAAQVDAPTPETPLTKCLPSLYENNLQPGRLITLLQELSESMDIDDPEAQSMSIARHTLLGIHDIAQLPLPNTNLLEAASAAATLLCTVHSLPPKKYKDLAHTHNAYLSLPTRAQRAALGPLPLAHTIIPASNNSSRPTSHTPISYFWILFKAVFLKRI